MVGHTGNLSAAIIAAETVDLCLKRILDAVEETHGRALITADHGNLEEMYELEKDGKIKIDSKTGYPVRKTSHTLNPVPFIIFDPGFKTNIDCAIRRSARTRECRRDDIDTFGI